MSLIPTLLMIVSGLLTLGLIITYALKKELSLKTTLALGLTLSLSFTYENYANSFNENFKNISIKPKLFSDWSISDWAFLKNLRLFSDDSTQETTIHHHNKSVSSNDQSRRSVDASTKIEATQKSGGESTSPRSEYQESESLSQSRSTQPGVAGNTTATSSRFLAVRTGSRGREVKVRLYDSRSNSWLDDETHVLEKEPGEGSSVSVGGVQAIYAKKRPKQ